MEVNSHGTTYIMHNKKRKSCGTYLSTLKFKKLYQKIGIKIYNTNKYTTMYNI